jgi:hypothetical protein
LVHPEVKFISYKDIFGAQVLQHQMNWRYMTFNNGSSDGSCFQDRDVLEIFSSAPDKPTIRRSMHRMMFVQRLVSTAMSQPVCDPLIRRYLSGDRRFIWQCNFQQHFSNN